MLLISELFQLSTSKKNKCYNRVWIGKKAGSN